MKNVRNGIIDPVKGAQPKYFLISQPKHVVGTLKNRFNETVLLSTLNICLNQ